MSLYKRFFGSRADRRGTDAELTMDLDLDFSECMEGIRNALAAFVSHARKAGLDAPVPTAPEWTVLDLVVHQGMVHRWATGHVLGEKPDPEALHAEGMAAPDPVIWLHDGGLDLIRALQSAPPDLEATVFLKNAPAPRQFWARRQCHETTIHSVDAQAAQLGRFPRAADTEITRQIALDGIDELLNGFLTRSKSTLRSEKPVRLGIRPTTSTVPGWCRSAVSRPSSSRTATSAPTWCSRGPRRPSTSRCGTGPTRSVARPTTSGEAPPR